MPNSKIVNKSIDKVTSIEEATQLGFAGTIETFGRLSERTISQGKYTPATIKPLLQRDLIHSGYYLQVDGYLGGTYQTILNESYDMYNNLYGTQFQFSQDSLLKIQGYKAVDLENFSNNANRAISTYTTTAINSQLTGVFNLATIDNIGKATKKLINDTNTWVTTSTSGLYRTSNTLLAQDNGLTKFTYMGILDSRTRPFCKRYIGQTRTQEEWNTLDNGQVNPVFVYAGGYNCRHSFVAVA